MPKSSKKDNEQLAKLSPDCSFLLTHLIRKNDVITNTTKQNCLSPKEKLLSILSIKDGVLNKPTLKAHSVGWYGTESTGNAKIYNPFTRDQFVQPGQTKGICFTESTLAGLKAHRDVFKTNYGLAFDRDYLFQKGANPCLNIRESLFKDAVKNNGSKSIYNKVHNFIPDQLIGFVNIIHESFDATHEREWRILGDFQFIYSDIKFVFCPEDEFKEFSQIQANGQPVLFDLIWLDRV